MPPPAGEASECQQHLRRAAHGLKNSLMTIAYYGFRVRMGEYFRDYGFETEDHFRESLDIPRSTWYKAVRIGEALNQLSLEDLQQISTGNAELLIQVQPQLWQDFPWIEEAKSLKPSEFAVKVADRNKQVGDAREPMTYYRCKVPFLAKSAIEEMVESFRQANNLASTGQALEFLMADSFDRPNAVAAIANAMSLISNAIRSIEKRFDSAENELEWLYQAKRGLHAAYTQKIQSSRETAGGQTYQGR